MTTVPTSTTIWPALGLLPVGIRALHSVARFHPGFLASIVLAIAAIAPANAEPQPVHAIAMHGEPALPADFLQFPYVRADAPKGGEIRHGVIGTFDSLNPFVLASMRTTARGAWDPVFGRLLYESLMARSADEPFSLYGLIAETVRMPEDRSWMEFKLREEARWADGKPIIPEDVIFTYQLLADKGRPPFSSRLQRIDKIEKTGPRLVKFTFNERSDREFPLIVAAFTPVLPKHAIDPDTFDASTLTPILGSGPYSVASVQPGSSIGYSRRKDYWGAQLPVNRGFYNFDRITIEYFQSAQAHFEAFKKGLFDVIEEDDPASWQRSFDFPAIDEGRVIKDSDAKQTPASMLGFVFNTRRAVFADRRVREALAMAFDFEWVNKNLFFNAYKRTASYWQGSALSALGVAADERERELLAAYPEAVAKPIMEGKWRPPVSDGSGRDRKVLRQAFNLLRNAGYKRADGKLVDSSGNPLSFEIMTRTQREERLAIAYKNSLELLGIDVSIRSVDDAQYQRRSQEFDFDMRMRVYSASLSPGIEQEFRWASSSRDLPGSFNFAGTAEPAIDAMIAAVVAARSRSDFEAAVRALDRVLISGHYIVPLYYLDAEWIARWSHIGRPGKTPLYGRQFSSWWDERAGN